MHLGLKKGSPLLIFLRNGKAISLSPDVITHGGLIENRIVIRGEQYCKQEVKQIVLLRPVK
jgi:hypothetical protein